MPDIVTYHEIKKLNRAIGVANIKKFAFDYKENLISLDEYSQVNRALFPESVSDAEVLIDASYISSYTFSFIEKIGDRLFIIKQNGTSYGATSSFIVYNLITQEIEYLGRSEINGSATYTYYVVENKLYLLSEQSFSEGRELHFYEYDIIGRSMRKVLQTPRFKEYLSSRLYYDSTTNKLYYFYYYQDGSPATSYTASIDLNTFTLERRAGSFPSVNYVYAAHHDTENRIIYLLAKADSSTVIYKFDIATGSPTFLKGISSFAGYAENPQATPLFVDIVRNRIFLKAQTAYSVYGLFYYDITDNTLFKIADDITTVFNIEGQVWSYRGDSYYVNPAEPDIIYLLGSGRKEALKFNLVTFEVQEIINLRSTGVYADPYVTLSSYSYVDYSSWDCYTPYDTNKLVRFNPAAGDSHSIKTTTKTILIIKSLAKEGKFVNVALKYGINEKFSFTMPGAQERLFVINGGVELYNDGLIEVVWGVA